MSASKNQNYLHGAAILTVAVLIIKILGAIYKIPLANIMGPEGTAHFNVAYNLYNVVLTLSTAGLPIALARLVSEANNRDKPNLVKRTFSVAMGAFIVLGILCSTLMLIFPTELAAFMGDVKAAQSMAALAPAVILVCVMSAFRGYTQGLTDMRPTSISQVLEVAVKVGFGLVILLVMNGAGYSTPLLSAGAISGVAVGSLVACLYIGFAAKKRMKSEALRYAGTEMAKEPAEEHGVIFSRLFKTGVPIALGSCVLSIITLINTKLIYDRLQMGAGFSLDEATAMFGEYSMALPLFNLPAAVITPLTISIVPAIAGFLARKEFGDAKTVVESSLRIATIIALPMAVGLTVLSNPVMAGLYSSGTQIGGDILMILGAAAFFVCMALMTTAILQASGREKLPMLTMLIGGLINIAINWYLLGQADINIYGAAIGTLSCYIIMSGLNLIFIMTKLPEKPKLSKVFFMPLVNSAVMGFVSWLIYPAALQIIGAGPDPSGTMIMIALVTAIGAGVVVYGVLTVITRAITMDDMKLIPKGEKLGKWLHIK